MNTHISNLNNGTRTFRHRFKGNHLQQSILAIIVTASEHSPFPQWIVPPHVQVNPLPIFLSNGFDRRLRARIECRRIATASTCVQIARQLPIRNFLERIDVDSIFPGLDKLDCFGGKKQTDRGICLRDCAEEQR